MFHDLAYRPRPRHLSEWLGVGAVPHQMARLAAIEAGDLPVWIWLGPPAFKFSRARLSSTAALSNISLHKITCSKRRPRRISPLNWLMPPTSLKRYFGYHRGDCPRNTEKVLSGICPKFEEQKTRMNSRLMCQSMPSDDLAVITFT